MSDEEREIYIVVRAKTSDRAENDLKTLVFVGRALHTVFEDDKFTLHLCEYDPRNPGFCDKPTYRYDQFGNDMGHHEGHNTPLIVIDAKSEVVANPLVDLSLEDGQ